MKKYIFFSLAIICLLMACTNSQPPAEVTTKREQASPSTKETITRVKDKAEPIAFFEHDYGMFHLIDSDRKLRDYLYKKKHIVVSDKDGNRLDILDDVSLTFYRDSSIIDVGLSYKCYTFKSQWEKLIAPYLRDVNRLHQLERERSRLTVFNSDYEKGKEALRREVRKPYQEQLDAIDKILEQRPTPENAAIIGEAQLRKQQLEDAIFSTYKNQVTALYPPTKTTQQRLRILGEERAEIYARLHGTVINLYLVKEE